ncbi:MAG: hypothetical protein IPJ65_38330 [Archangiaceae bacterium]|nr:hypothetical protein [Archangiaceae bacterium]
MTVMESVLQYVVAPLIPVIGALVVAGLGKLVQLLHAKQGESKLLGALGVGAELVSTSVSHVIDGLKPELQAALADGKIDDAEKATLKAKAMELLKKELPAGVQGVLSTTLGPALETWLSGKVTQAISAQEGAKPAANP